MQEIRGQESEIYSRFVPNRRTHIRCPFPDHEDRNPSFRSDSRTGRWFCSCGSGDVLDFVQRMGLAHNAGAAAAYIREALGLPVIKAMKVSKYRCSQNANQASHLGAIAESAEQHACALHLQANARAERESAAEASKIRQQRAKARLAWQRSVPIEGTPAETYLRGRGITCDLPATLRGLPPRRDGEHGAMIAPFALANEPEPGVLAVQPEQIAGVHLTFVANDGSPARNHADLRKITLGRGHKLPIVIAPINDGLGLAVCEGIEDALSAHQETGLGAWAAGTANRMPSIAQHVPDYVETVTVLIDNDLAGKRYGGKLVTALQERGIEVRSYGA